MTDRAFWTAVEHDEQCMPVTLNLTTCTVLAGTGQQNSLVAATLLLRVFVAATMR